MKINKHVCLAYMNIGKPPIIYEDLDDYSFYTDPLPEHEYYLYHEHDILKSEIYKDIHIIKSLKHNIKVIDSDIIYYDKHIRISYEINGALFQQKNRIYSVNYTEGILCFCVFKTEKGKELLYYHY